MAISKINKSWDLLLIFLFSVIAVSIIFVLLNERAYVPKIEYINKDVDLGGVLSQVLLYPLIISIVLERSIDVFSKTLREFEKQQIELKITMIRSEINYLKEELKEQSSSASDSTLAIQNKIKELKEKLYQYKTQRLEYKAHTRKYTMTWAMICGLILSTCGVRILDFLNQGLGINILSDNPSTPQEQFFILMDIILSAGLIAGGSASFHKIMKAIASFMDMIKPQNNQNANNNIGNSSTL